MKRILISFLVFPLFLFAQNVDFKSVQALMFEDAFENVVKIPDGTQKLIVSFGKAGNAIMSEYLDKQPKGFLEKNKAVYIGDIHKMPSIITYMFARPKMKKYNFTIFLYNDEDLAKYIPYKEDHVTVVDFDNSGNFIKSTFILEAQKAFE